MSTNLLIYLLAVDYYTCHTIQSRQRVTFLWFPF